MSLIPFHRLLIATAIAFCGGFAVWQLFAFRARGSALDLLIALAFAAAALGLAYYLRHLSRFLQLPEENPQSPRIGR